VYENAGVYVTGATTSRLHSGPAMQPRHGPHQGRQMSEITPRAQFIYEHPKGKNQLAPLC